MTNITDYILKLSISLAIVFMLYWFVLRNLTFYKWNRVYLVVYTMLCFLIPFIDLMPAIHSSGADNITIVNIIPVLQAATVQLPATPIGIQTTAWSLQHILLIAVVAVSLVLLLRMLIQFISLKRIIKQAHLVSDKGVKLYHLDKDIMPFSFGNSIFINPQLHNENDLHEIIRHEFVHIKQKHSIDIIWAEILCIINWFNPFAWLLRHAIRQNLEFIADSKVLENGSDKTQYQYLLLKVLGNNHFAIASPFNFSSLKRRIFMMNKIRTAKVHLLKFLFILPVLIILLLAFRSNTKKIIDKNIFTVAGIVLDNETQQPIDGVLIRDIISGVETTSNEKGYYALNIPIVRTDSLRIVFWYKKEGYPAGKENGGIRVTNPAEKQNAIVLVGIKKGETGTGIFGSGAAKVDGTIVTPDYSIVYEKYLNFLESKKTDALVKNSIYPVHVINGIPYAFGNGSKAWFNEKEVELSPDFKVWADGKIMTMEEANKNFNRFALNGVGVVPRKEAKELLGVDCNVLLLMKDSLSPVKTLQVKNGIPISPVTEAPKIIYVVSPSLTLYTKTMELVATGPFIGGFIGDENGTLQAKSDGDYKFPLKKGDIVKLNGKVMITGKSYLLPSNNQFRIVSFPTNKDTKERMIEITTIPL